MLRWDECLYVLNWCPLRPWSTEAHVKNLDESTPLPDIILYASIKSPLFLLFSFWQWIRVWVRVKAFYPLPHPYQRILPLVLFFRTYGRKSSATIRYFPSIRMEIYTHIHYFLSIRTEIYRLISLFSVRTDRNLQLNSEIQCYLAVNFRPYGQTEIK